MEKYRKHSQIWEELAVKNSSVSSRSVLVFKAQLFACLWVNVHQVCFLAQGYLSACSKVEDFVSFRAD